MRARFGLRIVAPVKSPEKSLSLSTDGVASAYFRLALPLFMAIPLHLAGSTELRNALIDVLGEDLVSSVEKRGQAIANLCKDFVSSLESGVDAIKEVYSIAEESLGHEADWRDLVEELGVTTGNLASLSRIVAELGKLGRAGEATKLMLQTTKFPELFYPQRAKVLLKDLGVDRGEQFVNILESMYRCLTGLYSVVVSERGGASARLWLEEVANRLGIPVTLRPPLYYLLIYFDADDASKVFAGIAGIYAGLLGANLYPVLAIEKTLGLLDSPGNAILVQPFYMAGDDYLVMAPPEVLTPLMYMLSSIIKELGLLYSAVVLAVHVNTPLREAIALAHKLMNHTAKEMRVMSAGAEKGGYIFARLTHSGHIDVNIVPLNIVESNAMLKTIHRLASLFATRVYIDRESLYALARKVVEACTAGFPEECEMRKFELLRGLRKLSEEELATELAKLFHTEVVEVPWSPRGPITRLNPGLEMLGIAVQLRVILPYTLWPSGWRL